MELLNKSFIDNLIKMSTLSSSVNNIKANLHHPLFITVRQHLSQT